MAWYIIYMIYYFYCVVLKEFYCFLKWKDIAYVRRQISSSKFRHWLQLLSVIYIDGNVDCEKKSSSDCEVIGSIIFAVRIFFRSQDLFSQSLTAKINPDCEKKSWLRKKIIDCENKSWLRKKCGQGWLRNRYSPLWRYNSSILITLARY